MSAETLLAFLLLSLPYRYIRWDYDRLSRNDFMGGMAFLLSDICGPEASGWYYLLPKREACQRNQRAVQVSIMGAYASSGQRLGLQNLDTTDVAGPCAIDGLDPEEQHRQATIYELISSEAAYLDDLTLVLRIYNFDACRKCMTRKDHDFIIAPLQGLASLSQRLLRQLYQRCSSGGAVDRVADVIQTHLPIMEPAYTLYCELNNRVSERISVMASSNPGFAALLASGKAATANLDLHSYRLKPLQRLTKYVKAL